MSSGKCRPFCLGLNVLIHWGRDKMAADLAHNILKWIFLNENILNSIEISLKFVPKVPINNKPALIPITAWHHIGNKPSFKPMIA